METIRKEKIIDNPSVNIMITNVCPNNCKYCFAPVVNNESINNRFNKDGSNSPTSFMSLDDFQHTLNFLKKSKLKNVRLLGGEPLIHPNIKLFIEEINKDEYFETITIFTGGIFAPELIKHLENDNIILVINCNHPKDYNPSQYKHLLSNIETMTDLGIKITIGYNIYEQNFDYIPIVNLCNDFGIDTLRICIANPNIIRFTEILSQSQRKKIGNNIYSMVMKCADNAIHLIFDCVLMPCIFTDEQWGKISKIYPRAMGNYATCTPAIDINPNLQATRCFSLGDAYTANLKQFNDSTELWQFFYEQIDFYKWYAAEDECKDCRYLNLGVCQGGCLGFTYSKIVALKESENKSKDIFGDAYNYIKLKDFNSAIIEFEKGLQIYKYNGAVICDYIFTLLKSHQFNRAESVLKDYDKILSIDKSGTYIMIKGLIAETRKDYKGAIVFYKQALRNIDKSKKRELLKRIENIKKM